MSMKIIDTHMHLGECRIFGLKITKQQILDYLREYNVSAVIVQPFPGAPDPVKVHDEIHELNRETGGKVYGLASINPFLEEDIVRKELERVLGTLGFVGIKIHTVGHAIAPTNPRAKLIFDLAAKYKVPVMIHTGPGPFSDPMLAAPRAEEYPDVKIILAHAGFGIYANAALYLARKYDNVYLEASWSHVYDLDVFLKTVPDKVMLGTDLIENIPVEYAKLKGLELTDEVKENYLYKVAKEVFKIKV
ncbi:MAG: amidohydrolase family protein [Thermoprotei archaeon]